MPETHTQRRWSKRSQEEIVNNKYNYVWHWNTKWERNPAITHWSMDGVFFHFKTFLTAARGTDEKNFYKNNKKNIL